MAYVVALATLGWAGYYFYADYKLQTTMMVALPKTGRFQTDLSYIDLPRISISLTGFGGHRGNVQMDITLEVENKYAPRVEGYRSRITDRLIHYTETLDYDDLMHPSSTKLLRPDMLVVINKAADPFPVRDVIFRRFLVL